MTTTAKLSTKEMQDILNTLGHLKDTFHVAAWKITGIGGWFKAFIKSQEFAALSDDSKEEAFDTFRSLDWILKYMEETIPEIE